jgi:hypothetical protein
MICRAALEGGTASEQYTFFSGRDEQTEVELLARLFR